MARISLSTGAVFVLLACLSLIGCDSGPPPAGGTATPFATEAPAGDSTPIATAATTATPVPTDAFAVAADPARSVPMTLPSGKTTTVPVNQMILLLADGAGRDDADRLAEQLGGQVVGQVREINFYQLQLPSTTLTELDALIDQAAADPKVKSVGYNAAPTLDQDCPAQNDNREIDAADRCPFAETEYYQAITMFEFFRPYLTLHPVAVGVIDTGLDPSTSQFDDVSVDYINNPGGPPQDVHPSLHGTAVCGMIAADDDFLGVNGVASRFLQSDLRLIVASIADTATAIAYTASAVYAGATVVNISLGWQPSDPRFEVIWHAWLELMGRRGDVVFVCSAGNEGVELDGFNYAPGGIGLPNVITVAGTSRCTPAELFYQSNYGPGVEVAAPGEAVPLVAAGGGYQTGTGTSFAAPMVTAVVAILRSLRPDMSPAQIRSQIRGCQLPLADGSPFGRLMIACSIGQLLLDSHVGDPIESWIDPRDLGHFGGSGGVLSRVCPVGLSFNVDGYGSHDLYEPDYHPAGTLAPTMEGITGAVGVVGGDDRAVLELHAVDYRLGSYVIMMPEGGVPPGIGLVKFTDRDSGDLGAGVAGTLTLDTCRIDQRSPFDGVTPMFVNLTGAFEGVLRVIHWDGRPESYHEFSGSFNVPCVVRVPDEPMSEYLENTCEGGIPRPPAGD